MSSEVRINCRVCKGRGDIEFERGMKVKPCQVCRATGLDAYAERDALAAELAAIKGQSGFDYSIRTQSTNRISAPAVDIGRNAAFEACPDTGCDWSSFYRGWNAALAAFHAAHDVSGLAEALEATKSEAEK